MLQRPIRSTVRPVRQRGRSHGEESVGSCWPAWAFVSRQNGTGRSCHRLRHGSRSATQPSAMKASVTTPVAHRRPCCDRLKPGSTIQG